MFLFYCLGFGGKLGNGKQYWVWIVLEDYLCVLCFLLENLNCVGVYNFVLFYFVINVEFNCWLVKQCSKFVFCYVFVFVLKWLFGECLVILLDN